MVACQSFFARSRECARELLNGGGCRKEGDDRAQKKNETIPEGGFLVSGQLVRSKARESSARCRGQGHDVIIQGNTKTRDALIEAEIVDLIRSAVTVQDLVRAASIANARLRGLEVFDSVHVTLDAGPPELPGTTNVRVEVVEAANPMDGSVGFFSKPEVSEH